MGGATIREPVDSEPENSKVRSYDNRLHPLAVRDCLLFKASVELCTLNFFSGLRPMPNPLVGPKP